MSSFCTTYPSIIFDTLTVGETYTFDGHDFTTPAKHQRRYTSTDGCDSVVTLHLCSREERYHTICSSSLPYTWEGVTFTQGGCDTVHFVPLAGTDSIIILHLGVRQPPVASFDVEHFCNDSTGYFLLLSVTAFPPSHQTVCYNSAAQYSCNRVSPPPTLLPPTIAILFPAHGWTASNSSPFTKWMPICS